MNGSWITIVEAELFDSPLGQVLGAYGVLMLLLTVGALIAVIAAYGPQSAPISPLLDSVALLGRKKGV